jgi:hypothetical protein
MPNRPLLEFVVLGDDGKPMLDKDGRQVTVDIECAGIKCSLCSGMVKGMELGKYAVYDSAGKPSYVHQKCFFLAYVKPLLQG